MDLAMPPSLIPLIRMTTAAIAYGTAAVRPAKRAAAGITVETESTEQASMTRLRTELQRLLVEVNLAEVARAIGTERSTVTKWRSGQTLPSARCAQLLISYFAGRLDHNGIYQPTPDPQQEA